MTRQTPDIEYSNIGMFTRFFPNTAAGAVAWREMAKADGVAAVLTFEGPRVIQQLRRAGYIVAKAAKPTMSVDEILAELN